jgi:hypothetical protein
VKDQSSPGGAFANLAAVSYRISTKDAVELKSGTADIVWFARVRAGR